MSHYQNQKQYKLQKIYITKIHSSVPFQSIHENFFRNGSVFFSFKINRHINVVVLRVYLATIHIVQCQVYKAKCIILFCTHTNLSAPVRTIVAVQYQVEYYVTRLVQHKRIGIAQQGNLFLVLGQYSHRSIEIEMFFR